jgi:hypothetical protein
MKIDMDTLAALGISKDDVVEKIVDRAAHLALYGYSQDEGGEDEPGEARKLRRLVSRQSLDEKLRKHITQQVDEHVTKLANEHVLPRVVEMIETLTLQRTNEWGEKRGTPVTFVEYLVQRADSYMREEVNYEGKAKIENGQHTYNWSKSSTRVAHMIDKHLHYSIERAMAEALKKFSGTMKDGLEGALKAALETVVQNAKVVIETKPK